MKKILSMFFILSINLWAEVDISQYLQIEFPKKFFPSYCELEDTLQSTNGCDAYIDNRHGLDTPFWCKESVCNSLLDSNIYFFIHDNTHSECYLPNENCLAFQYFVLSDATHPLMDVIFDEFKNYQRCHFLCISQQQLDSIFAEMKRILAPELERKIGDFFYNKPFYIKSSLEDNALMEDCDVGGSCLWGGGGDIEKILASKNAEQSLPYRMDFAARLRAENGSLIVPLDMEGRAFSLFRLNGGVLRKGELRNNMPLPHEPTILRVKGYGDMYLK